MTNVQNKTEPNAVLWGKVAVVTGSTSGIGKAIALELARCGACVLVHGRSKERAESMISALSRMGGEGIHVYSYALADLAQAGSHRSLVDKAWRWAGTCKRSMPPGTATDCQTTDTDFAPDIWVNNAGVDVLTGEAAGASFDEKLDSLWAVDVLATIRLSREVASRMKASGGGSIINIGWDQAEMGMAGDSGEMFAATKGAVMAFTRSLAKSSAPSVRVNCVAPGWIKTKWGDDTSEYWNARATGESLIGRWGEPDDVARAVRFLASPDAAFINGQTVKVNGGAQPWPVDWKANQDG